MAGRVNINPKSSSIINRREGSRNFYSSINRAQVTDVHIDRGTLSVNYVEYGIAQEVPFPILGISYPPKNSNTDKNYLRTSWGIYIPQVGDIILVGTSTKGEPFALGYSVTNYPAFNVIDTSNEERGGIGWGESSGIRLKPGDWSFKSSRRAVMYLGDRVLLSSGLNRISLNKTDNSASYGGDLIVTNYGSASEERRGSARRILVPGVDTSESYITSPLSAPAPCQEDVNMVKRGSLVLPTGIVMVHESKGEVINELTKTVMVPATAYPELTKLVGPFTRIYRAVKDDATGQIDLYVDLVDSLGNKGVSARTATGFQWATPLAIWDITCLDYTVTATTQISLKAPLVNLGMNATEFLVKGTTFVTNLTQFLSIVSTQAATAADAAAPTCSAAVKAIGVAAATLLAQLQSCLSVSVKTT